MPPSTASIFPLAGIKVSSLSFSAKNRLKLGHSTAVLSTQANSINYHKAEFEEFLSFRALSLSKSTPQTTFVVEQMSKLNHDKTFVYRPVFRRLIFTWRVVYHVKYVLCFGKLSFFS